jgi:ABC-type sugar transport system substrate-binding protein
MTRPFSSDRRSFLSICVALNLAATSLFIGCNKEDDKGTSSGSGGKTLTVGFSQIGAEAGWRTAETNSIQDEAKARGIKLKFSDGQDNQQTQIAALRSFIAQNVDAIILAPIEKDGWDNVLKEVQQAKIPVILVDRGMTADPSLYVTQISSDFIDEGHRAGEWMAKKMNGKASIAELQGKPGSTPAIDRGKGFADEIAKHPEMKVIKSQTANFTRKEGKEAMEAFLKSPEGPQINAVFAHNDEMAIGAIQAIEAAGKKPGTDIVVVSIDAVKDALVSMTEGKLNCSVECNPLLGPAAFDAVAKALKGEAQPKKTIIQDKIFDQDSAKDALPGRKY